MTAHKEEMKALNMQIAELEKTKVAAGGPNTKMGECATACRRSGAARFWSPATRTQSTTGEKFACLTVKKTLLEQRCVCEAKGLQFSATRR